MARSNINGTMGGDFDSAKFYVWVKGLESKVNNLLREVNVLKNDFIGKTVNLKKEVQSLNEEILEIKHEQDKTLQKIDLIVKELRQTAGVEEIETLKKYVEFWNPMNFVTQRDLERMIDLKLGERKEVDVKTALKTTNKKVKKVVKKVKKSKKVKKIKINKRAKASKKKR